MGLRLPDYGYKTRRNNVRAWAAMKAKRWGELLSWWLQP